MVSWTEKEPPDWRVYCLTLNETAECLRVHHQTVRKLIHSGELKAYKQKGRVRLQWIVPMWAVYDMQKRRAELMYQQLIANATGSNTI